MDCGVLYTICLGTSLVGWVLVATKARGLRQIIVKGLFALAIVWGALSALRLLCERHCGLDFDFEEAGLIGIAIPPTLFIAGLFVQCAFARRSKEERKRAARERIRRRRRAEELEARRVLDAKSEFAEFVELRDVEEPPRRIKAARRGNVDAALDLADYYAAKSLLWRRRATALLDRTRVRALDYE